MKNDAVAHEHLVADLNAVADEGVTLDLAVRAHDGSPLDLDEGADAGIVADSAAVEVRERMDDDVLAEFHVVDQAMWRVVGGPASHFQKTRQSSQRPRLPDPRSCLGR